MKTWICLLTGLLFFIVLIYAGQVYLLHSTSQLTAVLEQVSEALDRENWPETFEHFDQADHLWAKSKLWWAGLTHHAQINLVDQSLIRVREALNIADYSEARMELGVLRHLIGHVIRRETFSLSNIL